MAVSVANEGALNAENEVLRAENERLRGRIEALERALMTSEPLRPAQLEEPHGLSYRALFDAAPIALAVYRADGQLVAANRRHRQLSGEAADVPDDPSYIAAAAPRRAAALEQAARGEQVQRSPAFVPKRNFATGGSDRPGAWVETAYVAVAAGQGAEPEGVVGAPYVLEATFDVTERLRLENSMRETVALYESILENAPFTVAAKDTDGRHILANSGALAICGMSWEELRGKTDYDIFPTEIADSFWMTDREVMSTGNNYEREDPVLLPDGIHHYVTIKFALKDSKGKIRGCCCVCTDITTIKRAEAENRRLQEEIIRIQEANLRVLSTPLLPIGRGVVLMPLIGDIDHKRAQRILETLLDGIMAHSAESVILDVTGVPSMNGEIASSLVKTAQAAKLLGATVIMTGIQPTIAQVLVTLGADLSGVVTEGTLQSGIARVLKY